MPCEDRKLTMGTVRKMGFTPSKPLKQVQAACSARRIVKRPKNVPSSPYPSLLTPEILSA
jgi:hypothetical protein